MRHPVTTFIPARLCLGACVALAATAAVRAEIWNRGKEPYAKAPCAEVLAGARKGDVWAAKRMGDMLRDGDGVPADPREAAAWYALAAAGGCAPAENNLGVLYQHGQGLPRNPVEAVARFYRAATQGLAQAQWNLAMCLRSGDGVPADAEEALEWFRRAADQGYAPAQFEAGFMLLLQPPPDGDPEAGIGYLRKAAAQDHAGALYELGRCHHLGVGVRQNDREAFRHYLRAAEAGHPEGQKWAGNCYLAGRGVGRNCGKAREWYLKALERMPRDGQILHNLALMHARGEDGVERNPAAAVAWLRRAAESGFGPSQVQLALHLERGDGAPPDPETACMWMMLAARGAAREAALFELGRMQTKLSPDQVRRAAERAAAFRPAGDEAPRLRIEGIVVEPPMPAAGAKFGFRCRVSDRPPGTDRGRVECVQRILRGPLVLFESEPQPVDLRPGPALALKRTGLTAGAQGGAYVLQVELRTGTTNMTAAAPFFVETKRCEP